MRGKEKFIENAKDAFEEAMRGKFSGFTFKVVRFMVKETILFSFWKAVSCMS